MTLRIEDGGRVYEFVAQTTHRKMKLITIEALYQVLQSLCSEGKGITDRDDRVLANLGMALDKLRKTWLLKEA